MKYVKKIFTLFMCSTVLLSLAGCAEKNTDLEKNGQTVKTKISSNTFAQKYVAPTEDGYYIIDDGILSFIDIKSEKEIPVLI